MTVSWPLLPLCTAAAVCHYSRTTGIVSPQTGYVGILAAPTFSRWPRPRRSSICRCCGCCCLAKMGVSRAHELVPRSFSLMHGTDPCTTEDHPLSVFVIALFVDNLNHFCHAHRAAQNTSFALYFLPRTRTLPRADQYFVVTDFIILCRASLTHPNILSFNMVVQKK